MKDPLQVRNQAEVAHGHIAGHKPWQIGSADAERTFLAFIKMSKRQKRTKRNRAPSRASFRLFNSQQTYLFRLCQNVLITSNGSGVAAGYIVNDPTSTMANFGEHVNYLTNLFTEYRIIRSRWTFVTNVGGSQDSKTTSFSPLAIGVYLRTSSSLPSVSSANQVLDNQPSFQWNVINDASPRGMKINQWFDKKINFQLTTTTSTDYAGAPGGILYYGGALPVSVNIASVTQEVWLLYRGRS